MTPRVTVSRYFEPVPRLAVEARYRFHWDGTDFENVELSIRKDREDGHNSQFDNVEELPMEDVPASVHQEAQTKLNKMKRSLQEEA